MIYDHKISLTSVCWALTGESYSQPGSRGLTSCSAHSGTTEYKHVLCHGDFEKLSVERGKCWTQQESQKAAELCWVSVWKPGLYPPSPGSKIQNPLVTAAQSFVCVNLSVNRCARMHISVRVCVCVYTHLQGFVWMRLAQSCSVSQVSDMWICGWTAEAFITDNYIRMYWKRNKPRTVWAGRCWASAYTVPRALCATASHAPAPTGPL